LGHEDHFPTYRLNAGCPHLRDFRGGRTIDETRPRRTLRRLKAVDESAPFELIHKMVGEEARKFARAVAALVSLALLLLPARSADRKKSLLPFGRRGGIEPGLLNAPRLLSLLLGSVGGLSCSLVGFRGSSLCGLACCPLASDPLAFRDPDVAGGDDLRSSIYSPQPSRVFRNCPCTFNLSFLRSAGSS
jgi:hypothetical protein